MQLKLLGVTHFNACDLDLFGRLGAKLWSGLDARAIAQETIAQLAESWDRIHPGLPMLEEHKTRLREHWMAVPCLREHGPLK